MIKLTRGPKPHVLIARAAEWTQQYLGRVRGDMTVPKVALTRYRDDEIKAAVIRDSSGKCIYCESKPLAVYPGAVEHILPKGADKFPELVVEWENLGFVCFECNRLKLDYWEEGASILDPYVDDPEAHLVFFGPLVLARPASVRGRITVAKLELDRRADLIERKAEHIRTVETYLRNWSNEPPGPLKAVLEAELRRYAESTEEYTATARALLRAQGFPAVA